MPDTKKYLDKDGLLYFSTRIKSTFVEKETGKGLSTEDYTTAEKTKLAGFDTADKYALKTDISTVYRYKGSVASVAALPASADVGDVYNVEANGKNYAWTGSEWDDLGGEFVIDSITNAEIDTILAT